MVEEKIENILNAQPIKYYPNKEDAQRVLRERNARLAGQISQLFEPKRECIYCPKPADGAMLIMGNLMAHPNCVIQKLNELLDPDYDGSEEPARIVGVIEQVKRDIFNKTVHAAEHRERFVIEQAKAEVAKAIFDTIETGGYGIPYILTETSKKDWQALKVRYGVK